MGSWWQGSGRATQPTRSFNMTHRLTTAGSPFHQQEEGRAQGHNGRWNRVVLPGRAGDTEAAGNAASWGRVRSGSGGRGLGLTPGVSEERVYTVKVSF